MNVNDAEIKSILEKYKKVTVWGLSPNTEKPSHKVPLFMRSQGFEVVGIYPRGEDFADFKIYKDLIEVPKEYRKFVDVFQRSEKIPEVVDQILELGGTEVLWLQLGVFHPEAEKKAEAAGLKVISNRCPHIEINRLFPSKN